MRIFRRPSTLAEALTLAAVLGVVALILFINFGVWQVSRTVVAVSSDPFRDLPFVLRPSADGSARQPGLAGAFARGDRVNLLLLGYGGAGHDGPFLTDSLMLVSLNGLEGAATLISIPRDVWVTIPKGKYNPAFQAKINEAFAIGANRADRDEGMRLAAAVVSDVLGITIERTVALDFRAFKTVVDRIGGIEVTVDRAFSSIYPASETDESWIEISFKAGPQHLDGEAALRYSRARYADGPEGSDFARSARQQKVILATRDKVAATGAAQTLLGLLDALRDNVRTDLSLADMRALGEVAKNYDDASTVRGALTNQNLLQNYNIRFADGLGFTLQPRVEGFGEVRAYVRRLFDSPGSLREDPLVAVQVSERRSNAGAQAVDRLSDLGFRARLEVVAGDDPGSTVVSGGAVDSVGFLATYFSGHRADLAGAVVVRLGTDWQSPKPFTSSLGVPPPASPTAAPRSASPSVQPSPSPSAVPSPSATPSTRPSPSRTPDPVER
ncbi:MAG: LytR family transcriptional regulator [Chloroflexi bacterium]|nr:LytR family transcriptional regulator [Chloroflexota bacterium]